MRLNAVAVAALQRVGNPSYVVLRADWWSLPCSFGTGSGMTELDGLTDADGKVINSKKKVDENVVSPPPLFYTAKPAAGTN